MIIGIIHHDSTKRFLKPLLKSLKGVKYQVCIIHNNKHYDFENTTPSRLDDEGMFKVIYNPTGGFELGALKALMDAYPKENDFFLMHNTTLIKDQEIFDIAAQFNGTLAMSNGLMSFLGKYRRQIIEKIGIPIPQEKGAAIYYEYFWNIIYFQFEDKIAICDDPLKNSNKLEVKFGRRNMVLENKYLKKWKSNYVGMDVKMPSPQSFIP